VSRPSDALAVEQAADGTLNALLLGLGGLVLLVGGIGVANTMVVEVLERRSEIGLRRALGASRVDVRRRFLAEAVLLAVAGGTGEECLGCPPAPLAVGQTEGQSCTVVQNGTTREPARMIVRCSVRDADTGARYDVEVSAEPDTSVASLLEALPIPVGGRACFADDEPFDPETTLGDSPLLHGSTIWVGAPGPPLRGVPEGGAGAVRVVAGPDVGLTAWLRPGRHRIGRAPDAQVRLTCDRVSRNHAVLIVDPNGVVVEDLESVNGTRVDGEPIAGPVSLTSHALIGIGADELEWVPRPAHPLRTVRAPDGRLEFNRSFVPSPNVTPARVDLPEPPVRAVGGRGSMWVGALAPVAIGLVLFLVQKNPLFLVMCAVGPVGLAGTEIALRRGRRRELARVAALRVAARAEIDAHVRAEERVRRAQAPDRLDLILAATGADRSVWPRNAGSPSALTLRVGVTDEPASVELRGTRWPELPAPTLSAVPMTVDLRQVGVLGIAGPPAATREIARWLLIQLGVLRSPDDLRIVLISATDGADLAWASWLPHVDAGEANAIPCWVGTTEQTRARRVAELRDLIIARAAARRAAPGGAAGVGARFTEDVVVVLDGALSLRNISGMKAVLREGPEAGVYVIALDQHGMNECRAEYEVDSSFAIRLHRGLGEPGSAGRADRVSSGVAARLSRAVAPLRDRLAVGSSAAMPFPVRFLDLLSVGVPTADDVVGLWREHDLPTLDVPLGAGSDGTVRVDLAGQGPHTMLGGATGAGKSILLQTLVTSLLLANSPEKLNLVLVDFKGGSAFLPFERCPHVVALIRSTGESAADVFDETAANRVLASVRAEVRRRESLLALYGGEIDEYWRARRSSSALPPLPRLVMIFDEFARVLETSPNFLRELVNVAAKGRSLGMHLVLATQSLQGKLSAELKNNIDLRITLRQNEPADSTEVLGVPDAASIPGRLRGRGMILCTKDETRTPRLFQSGYLGDPPPVGGARPARVRIAEWASLGTARPDETVDHRGAPTDQLLTVRAVEAAAGALGARAPFRPLLPPLPAHLPRSRLGSLATASPANSPVAGLPLALPAAGTPSVLPPSGEAGPLRLPFGLIDDPDNQAQPVAALDLVDVGRLLVAGGPQTGRTTFVRTLITSLVTRLGPDAGHVYVIEHAPAGLSAYAGLPHCGAIISGGEPDRVRRLVSWLRAEVDRRRSTQLASMPRGEPDPAILFVVDGWELFENRSDPMFVATSVVAAIVEIIQGGPPVGVHVVLTGGADLLLSRTAALFTQRLLLPFGKEELRRAHLGSGMVSPPDVPGRAIDASTGLHVQIAWPDRPPDLLVRDALIAASASASASASAVRPDRLPRSFPPLPRALRLEELAVPAPPPSKTWLPLGVGGADLDVVGVDFFETGPHQLLVSGPGGSGRTSAAATVVRGLREHGVGVLVVAPSRSPLPELLDLGDADIQIVRGTSLADATLRAAVEPFGDRRYAVVVDDCEQITVTPTVEGFADKPTLFQDIVSPDAFGQRALVLCGDAAPILSGQRRSLTRVVSEILSSGTRLLLTPTSVAWLRDHNLRLEPDQLFAAPPGRGYLISDREVDLIQSCI